MEAVPEDSLWKWWLGITAVVVALYTLPLTTVTADALYILVSLSVPVAIIWGVRRHQPEPRAPWRWLIGAGIGVFLGDVLWFRLAWSGLPPYPSVADVVFLGAYVSLGVGLGLLVRHRTTHSEISGLLDAAVISVGAGVVTWLLAIGPLLDDSRSLVAERLVAAGYPLLDVLLVAVVARLAFAGGGRNRALGLLAVGLVANLVGDVAYVLAELDGVYAGYGVVDLIWLVSYLLIGTAALHPSMADIGRRVVETPAQVRPLRLAAVVVASAAAPFALLVQWVRGGPLAVPMVTIGAIAAFALVAVRVSDLGRQVAVTQAQSEARFRSLVHHAADVIVVLDTAGVITYASPAMERVWQHRDVAGTPFARLLHPEDVGRFEAAFAAAGSATFDGRVLSPDGQWHPFEAIVSDLRDDPAIAGLVLTCRDTTERVRLEAQLTHQAFHDPLTGLPNRALFLDRVQHAMGRLARRDQLVGVLFIDLDDFKAVNDGMGHSAGDALLRGVGRRLTAHLRPGDTVARIGGDEFGVLVEDAADQQTVTAVAERIIAALEEPFTIESSTVTISATIGIAARETAVAAPMLIRDADIAMYHAKAKAKGRYTWFHPPMRVRAVDRWKLRSDLADALGRGEMFLVYQPIIDLSDGRVAGAEALLRWRHPTRGIILPDVFIAVAEQTGMIIELGEWVLHSAAMEAARWWRRGVADGLYVSVNVSAAQLRDRGIVANVGDVLRRADLPPGALMLELTESTLMEDVDHTRAVFHELKEMGVAVAVDDFGTGYSSLAYLRELPVDVLKIDRSFVTKLGDRITPRNLARDIIALGQALDLSSVAEGIETPEQLRQLQAMNCALGQGYHLCRPMDADELFHMLDSRAQAPVSPAGLRVT